MILSIHIPKTAGVSLRNVLKEHFGPGFVAYYWQITDAWGQVIPEVPTGAICVHGHFQTDQLASRFPSAGLMTWVRDPVDRVISSYYHRLRDPDLQHPVCVELHQRKLSLVDYAALPLVRNEMTHFFGSKAPEDFMFIGVVEDFEHSLSLLKTLLKMPVAPVRCDNINPLKPVGPYSIDPGVRREIQQLNERDVGLYERCLQRAQVICSEISSGFALLLALAILDL